MPELGWWCRSECLAPETVRKTLGWKSGCCFFMSELGLRRRSTPCRCRKCAGVVVGRRWPVAGGDVCETEAKEKKREMTCMCMLLNCPSFFVVGQNCPQYNE
ncbi:hypothetical protein MtrunA17_Chr1g0207941 [Medicago truncatula]|uniref:Uncharacterized protein n=1 Tax=Medicago truncatula TaxID=3880 RepID=A0A072W1C5_MEDTR|nr:hypothetical protein MTR_1g107355 [Medicago truncatula]RHN74522.1 hypothetical protein MtrunA17_Chr2g0311331 [Medicago truncatula]RHN82253.1 hypothetical protein MtrunA17_Chr1g0207941 [Medicago truncatula]